MMTTGLIKTTSGNELLAITLGHPLLDDYLEFVAARARPNTLLAAAYDLKVFFTEVVKQPADVSTADVLGFINHQGFGEPYLHVRRETRHDVPTRCSRVGSWGGAYRVHGSARTDRVQGDRFHDR